jgi:GT2 family glycosyltransferase
MKELEGLRVVLAIPTYGPVDPICARDSRLNVMVAAKHGVEWAADNSPNRVGWSVGRNAVAKSLLEEGKDIADGIMWIDSDMRLKPSDVANLLLSARHFNSDFVTGVYFQREGQNLPVLYEFDNKVNKFRQIDGYPDNGFIQIGGCGFGFVWTGRKVIEAIANHKDFDEKDGWFPDKRDAGGFGEDLSFCYQARRAGIQLHVNTSIELGHLGDPDVIGKEDFLRKKSERNVVVR